MPMKARYTVIDGEVIAEKRGGVRRQYVPDPLGSTVALLDNTQTKTDTFSYWPYGEEATRTGTTATPFRFVGTMGYYRDSTTKSYVRARYLETKLGRWATEDPIEFRGGSLNLYLYVHNHPISVPDPSGLGDTFLDPFIDVILIPYRNCRQCLERKRQEAKVEAEKWGSNGFGGHHDGDTLSNAYKHCVGSCLAAKDCGGFCAGLSQWAYEMFTGSAYWTDYRKWKMAQCMDFANNEIGYGCVSSGNCTSCCDKAACEGKFEVIDPSGMPLRHPRRTRCREYPLTGPPPKIYL